MSLAGQINALATRVAQEIKSVRAAQAATFGSFVEKTMSITAITEFTKVSFLKVTVPSTAGSYRVDIDVQMGSITNAGVLQTSARARYLLRCTTTTVTVIELETTASAADTYLAPVVSGRDVTFAAQYGTNGGATATGVLTAFYRVPNSVTTTELNTVSTAASTQRDHYLLRSSNGSTANRPAARGAGDVYFDTTLGRQIVWSAALAAWQIPPIIFTTQPLLDFPSIAAGGSQELSVTLTGAELGDAVQLGPPAAIEAGLIWNAYVSAVNTVKIRVSNLTAAAIDPVSASWRATIVR